jgi:twitching motility two-component system response regulator PilG
MDFQQKKILIVEDDNDARTIFLDILNSAGFNAIGAVDGIEALDKLSKNKFDLVLLDIIMPNKDGITTLSEILADPGKYGNMDVYMLTNIDSDITIQKAVEIGAKGYFLKSDLNPEQLVETVKKYIQ